MSEEPRRSVRSTKGFHSHKEQEIEGNLEMPKKKSTKKGGGNKKATSSKETSPTQEANEEGDIIRCVCGATSQEDDDDGEQWIACELCSAWQHNVCMGVPTENVESLPEYYCEQCRPQNHKELVKSIAQGDELWITRRKDFEAKKGKKGKKPAKGKGGSAKKKSPPTKPTGQRSNGQAVESPVPPGHEASANPKKDSAAGTKRKAQEDSQVRESGKTKQRKISDASAMTMTPVTGAKKSSTFPTPAAPRSATPTKQTSNNNTPRDLPKTIADLKDDTRVGLAKYIHKNVGAAFKSASERGQLTDDTPSALQLTLQIERAIHDSHHPGEQYATQSKLVAINLKRNDELFDKLLSREVSATQLAVMSEDDMKSTKQKQEEAEELARAERQSIMVKEDGPRVRRTHKGEELVEDSFGVGNEIPTREQRDPNGDMAVRSRENTPLELIQPELDVSDTVPRARQPLNINTQAGSHERKPSIQSAEFDYNKVASKLPTPINTQPNRRASGPAPPPREAVEDPDVDRMLLDDDPESPPYSPKEDSDPSVVWNGQLEMTSIGTFAASAQHVGGMDFVDQNMNYSDILGKKLLVTGRIEPEKANDYLCGLRYSPNSDVIVISLAPRGEIAAEDFGKIFAYFADKDRYGVCGSRMGPTSVRDIYLIPLEAGNGAVPLFLSNLEVNKLPESRLERTILIVIVHRVEATSPNPESPSIMTHAQRTTSQFSGGPAMSPLNTQGAFKSPTAEREEKHAQQLAGEALGLEVLGPELILAPTMAFILPQAGAMNYKEWTVIKEILSTDERARVDLSYLGQLLADKATHQQAADNEMKNV